MDNEKLENLLNLALDATEEERRKSLELNVGYNAPDRTWQIIVKASGGLARTKEQYPEITAEELLNGYAILTIPQELLGVLTSSQEIEYVEKPKRLFFAVDEGRRASCVTPLQTAPEIISPSAGSAFDAPSFATNIPGVRSPDADNLFGAGVLIAVIDSGIDYAHADFRNEDGTTRIVELWDQTLNRRFDSELINEALTQPAEDERYRIVPSRDISGHGTHVAGICAGNGRASQGRCRGVAPQSPLLIVKVGSPSHENSPRTAELMRAVDYCLRKASSLRLPVAVNISFGNNYGSHDGSSLLETYLNDVSSFWKSVIVIGAGNEGASRIHAAGQFLRSSVGTYPPQTVPFSVGEYEPALNIQIWKSFSDQADIAVRHPDGTLAGPLRKTPGAQRFSLGNTDLLAYYGEPSPYSTDQEIYLDFIPRNDYLDAGIWEVILSPRRVVSGDFDLWMPGQSILNAGTGFLYPAENATLTIPSTAAKVLTVGAYNSGSLSYAPFSGRGYANRADRAKPDLAAPGVDIVSAAPGGGYAVKSGTSMAAPFVTGAAALLMEWGIVRGNDPFLYGEKIKAYLIRGAKQLPAIQKYPNPQIGWGVLCAADSLFG